MVRPLQQGGFAYALQYLTDEILAGRLRAGSRLPAERDLAERLGVGRGAVREAIRALQAQGLVTSTVGQAGGTHIAAQQGPAFGRIMRLHMALHEISYDELTETRVLLERAATEAAAGAASAEALADLVTQCDAMVHATDLAGFNQLDTEFHVAIAGITRNRLVRDLTIAIREAVSPHIFEAERALPAWPRLRERLIREHRAIVDAIAAGDGAGAAELAERHVRGAHAILLRLQPLTPDAELGVFAPTASVSRAQS